MPEFYLIPKRLARKAPLLASVAKSVEAATFRATFWLLRKLSLDLALRLSALTFGLLGVRSGKAAKARENLAIAFPQQSKEWREQTTREIFHHVGRSAAELIKLDQIWEQREQRIEFVFEPLALKQLESGGSTMFVTAHVGAWQVAALAPRKFGFDIGTIYAPESNPVMNELMLGLRKSFGDTLIPADAGPRPIMQALKGGRSIIMAMDTRPDTGKLIPFFGREALTNTSAAGLALRTGSALILGRGERLPDTRYRVTLYDPLVSPIPDAPIKEQAVALTEIIHGYFETWIKEYPEQWVCLKRRWPKEHKL